MIPQVLPKVSLGFFPTPLVELPRLSKALGGPQIFMKRDDQTGLALGGNKTRKLEYLLGDATARGCDTIITAGATQSNHCRQTAAAAAKLGLACHLVLGGAPPGRPSGNLLLNQLFGCRIHWSGDHRKGEDLPKLSARLAAAGKTPYTVPYGGSNALGAFAFVEAARELEAQRGDLWFSHVVFASSSGGTQAGLVLGKQILQQHHDLIGIQVDKETTGQSPLDQQVLALANQTADRLGLGFGVTAQDILLNNDYLGRGYAVVGELENEAIALTARTEGVLLDPIYTGRAMGGLIDMIRNKDLGRQDRVLFWHTGGTPALFAERGPTNEWEPASNERS